MLYIYMSSVVLGCDVLYYTFLYGAECYIFGETISTLENAFLFVSVVTWTK
jgi:hypothetical protein